jgi:hypothetical protein
VRREGRFRDTNNCGFLLFLLAVANTFYLRFITMIERYRLSTDHRRSSLASSVLLIQSMRERLAWPLTPLCGITARTSGGACDLGSEPQHSLAMASLHSSHYCRNADSPEWFQGSTIVMVAVSFQSQTPAWRRTQGVVLGPTNNSILLANECELHQPQFDNLASSTAAYSMDLSYWRIDMASWTAKPQCALLRAAV